MSQKSVRGTARPRLGQGKGSLPRPLQRPKFRLRWRLPFNTTQPLRLLLLRPSLTVVGRTNATDKPEERTMSKSRNVLLALVPIVALGLMPLTPAQAHDHDYGRGHAYGYGGHGHGCGFGPAGAVRP